MPHLKKPAVFLLASLMLCAILFSACSASPAAQSIINPSGIPADADASGSPPSSPPPASAAAPGAAPGTPSPAVSPERPGFIQKVSITGYWLEEEHKTQKEKEAEGNLLPMDVLIALSKKSGIALDDFTKYYYCIAPISSRLLYDFYMANGYLFTLQVTDDAAIASDCTLSWIGTDVESAYYVNGFAHIEEFAAFIASGAAQAPAKPEMPQDTLEKLMRKLKNTYKDAILFDATNDRFAGERMIDHH